MYVLLRAMRLRQRKLYASKTMPPTRIKNSLTNRKSQKAIENALGDPSCLFWSASIPERLYECPGGNMVDGLPPAWSIRFGLKNRNISQSVNSFDLGVIFHWSWAQKLSRDVFVSSIYRPGAENDRWIGFGMTQKIGRKFVENKVSWDVFRSS